MGSSIDGSITAGERDGKVAEGLQHGNSPLEYPRAFIEGRTIVLTTTNGTRLLHMVRDADTIVIGSFLNLTAVCNYLLAQGKKVLLGCASWKDKFNLEDTLFAGAVVHTIGDHFEINCDSARAARHLYRCVGDKPIIDFLRDSSHYRRLSAFGLVHDMEYCTVVDQHPVLPYLSGSDIVVHP